MAYEGNHPIPSDLRNEKKVDRLLSEHARIEAELHEKSSGLAVDWDGIRLLKRRKLMVDDQIEILRRTLN